MAQVKCYLVKFKDLISISEKAFKAVAYDGSECILPKSQVVRPGSNDNDWYVSCWIMDQKEIQHSKQKVFMVNSETMQIRPFVVIETHVPEQISVIKTEANADLVK